MEKTRTLREPLRDAKVWAQPWPKRHHSRPVSWRIKGHNVVRSEDDSQDTALATQLHWVLSRSLSLSGVPLLRAECISLFLSLIPFLHIYFPPRIWSAFLCYCIHGLNNSLGKRLGFSEACEKADPGSVFVNTTFGDGGKKWVLTGQQRSRAFMKVLIKQQVAAQKPRNSIYLIILNTWSRFRQEPNIGF